MSTNQTEIPSIPVETTTPVVPTQPEADTQVQATTEVIPEPAVAAATESAETPSGDVVPESNDTDAPAAVEASPLPSLNIEEGFVSKRGPLPLRLWQKRYFRLPSGNLTYPLHKLHIVYKKNAKKQALPAEEFEKTNQYLLDTLATATVNANAILSYFKTDSKDELPQGLINLKHVVDITPSPKIKPFAFTIKTKSREYVFSTSSQKDTDSWVATLKSMASAEIPDFSDTAAYKFSYTQLIERKVLTAPQSQDEEVFSASEAEAESDEAPAKVVTEPTAQEGEATQTKTSESNESPQAKSADPKGDAAPEITNQRKSFYSEVKGFFRKGAEGDAKKDETAESASKGVSAEPSDEAVKAADAQPSQEGLALETAGESKASEFSQEIAEMVAPISSDPPALEPETSVVPAEESTENRPTRTKTFNIPKFEGKIFSKIFKKNGQEETQGSKDDFKPADAAVAAVETPKEQTESSTENQAEPSSQEAPSSSEVKTEAPVDAASETPEVKDGEAKEAQEIVAPVESVDKTEPVSQETKKATDTVKSDKRPFIKRLISGSTRSKNAPVEVASETDKAADAEATPAEATSEVAEAKDATVEPVEAKESAVETEGEAKTEESKPVDANAQRQTSSFITRIGEMAYSAVSSPAPEGEEQISEAFVEKAKSAKRSGFLYKQSTLLHTNNLRFVILSDDGALTYFRNAQTPAEGKKITITSTTELLSTDELLFSIKLATGSTLIFQAKTQEDRDAWLSALESFAKAAVETTTVPEPTTPTGEPVTLDTELPQVASASTIAGAEPAADEPVTDAKPSTPEVPTVTDAEVTAPAIEEPKATPANN